MNKTKARFLAGLMCTTLFIVDVLSMGLVTQAAEVLQQAVVETEQGETEDEISEELPEQEKADIEEAEMEDAVDTENGEDGEAETSEGVSSDEETEASDSSLPEEEADMGIDKPEIQTVQASDVITLTTLAEGSYNENGSDIKWELDGNGKLTVTGTGEIEKDSQGLRPWYEYRDQIKTAQINVSGMKDASNLFWGCQNLSKVDLSGFNTENVMDMSSMFSGCRNLTELDLSGFNTRSVTNMESMFSNCESLTELNVSGFNTENVTDMSGMFWSCENLVELDLSGLNTENVTTMDNMFLQCYSLKKLNLSSFNTRNVTTMVHMFRHCDSLIELDVSKFDTGNVKDMSGMFGCCYKLTKLDLSGFDTGNVTRMSQMFTLCESLTKLDLSSFNTSNVQDMHSMFEGCESLTELDVSSFNTSSVSGTALGSGGSMGGMALMFNGCESLTELDVSGFDTGNVLNMGQMFGYCKRLKRLDVSGFNIRNVTSRGFMTMPGGLQSVFIGCESLTELYLSNWDMDNINIVEGNVESMFDGCSSLAAIYTPMNVKGSITLPKAVSADVWYRADSGGTLKEIPQNMSYSILLSKNKKAEIQSHIVAKIAKTDYLCGEIVKIENLTVTLYLSDGTSRKLHSTDYTTNIDAINKEMSTAGTKTLTVTYENGGSLLTADIELFVRYELDEVHTTITLTGVDSLVYDGTSKTPVSTVVYNISENDTSVTSMTLEEGKDYTVSYRNNINACENIGEGFVGAAPTVVIHGKGNYSGSISKAFIIQKATAPTAEVVKESTSKCQTENNGRKLNLSGSFKAYGKKTEYQILNVAEDNTIEGSVFSGTPVIDGKGILTYNTNAGTKGDFATVTVKVSFANYQDATLTVIITMIEEELLVVSGIVMKDSIYTGREVTFSGEVSARREDGTDVTKSVELTYTYSGTREDGSVYPETDAGIYTAPTDAGKYTLTVTAKGENYIGSADYSFIIKKAPVIITVKDVIYTQDEVKNALPTSYQFDVEGLLNGDNLKKEPDFTYTNKSGAYIAAGEIDRTIDGIYYIIPGEAIAGMNYDISYRKGMLMIMEEKVAYTVSFDMMGHGGEIAVKGVNGGRLLEAPDYPVQGERVEDGSNQYIFVGWYKDKSFAKTKEWNFELDTVQQDTTLYACWLIAAKEEGSNGLALCVQEISEQTYTGKEIKPSVTVYTGDGSALLKAGKDYTIKYYNNKEADTGQEKYQGGTGSSINDNSGGFTDELAYVVISGKGQYQGSIYQNFHINPVDISEADNDGNMIQASGFTLKYSDQLIINDTKAQKVFYSLKYKEAMKAGTDFKVKLRSDLAYDKSGNEMRKGSNIDESSIIPSIPAGYNGMFTLTITGQGNYSGTFSKKIVVADKNKLMKNATIKLGKNIKTQQYNGGEEITLTPGYYDSRTKKYYGISENGSVSSTPEIDGNGLFTVSFGNISLIYGRDYTVSYANNKAVGTATMIVTGIGDYKGSKKVTFKIMGTTFSTKNVVVTGIPSNNEVFCTGRAQTFNKEIKLALKGKDTAGNATLTDLRYGTDYNISYKNNVKKETATLTFTANPESGYTGKFDKNFKIGAVSLADSASVKVEAACDVGNMQDSLTSSKDEKGNTIYKLNGTVLYTREGAKPSQRIRLSLLDKDGNTTGVVLKEGIDYTVSYTNNTVLGATTKIPTMTFKGKGNYIGSLKITFTISEAAMETDADNLIVTAAAVAINDKNSDEYNYAPAITVKDGKKTLRKNKDYTVKYENCSQTAVKAYLDKLGKIGNDSSTVWADVKEISPRAVITAVQGSGYMTMSGKEITVYLNIYKTKLTGSNLYVVVSDTAEKVTYNGQQIKPEVAVYYGDTSAVKKAKNGKVTLETELTGSSYGLKKLFEKTDAAGDYTLDYGTNVETGKNKGEVIVSGTGIYGGNVTVKFDILKKNVYQVQ